MERPSTNSLAVPLLKEEESAVGAPETETTDIEDQGESGVIPSEDGSIRPGVKCALTLLVVVGVNLTLQFTILPPEAIIVLLAIGIYIFVWRSWLELERRGRRGYSHVNALFTANALLAGGVILILLEPLAHLGFGGFLVFVAAHTLRDRLRRIRDMESGNEAALPTLKEGGNRLDKRNLSGPYKIILVMNPIVAVAGYLSIEITEGLIECVQRTNDAYYRCREDLRDKNGWFTFNNTQMSQCLDEARARTASVTAVASATTSCAADKLSENALLGVTVSLVLIGAGYLVWYKNNKCRSCVLSVVSCGIFSCPQHGPHSGAAAAAEASAKSTAKVLKQLAVKGIRDVCSVAMALLPICAVSFAYGFVIVLLIHYVSPGSISFEHQG